MRTEEDVTRQPWAAQGFDKVLLDPARAGAGGVMQHIAKLAPQRVVYVSCNPTTLARDSRAAGCRLPAGEGGDARYVPAYGPP